MPDLTDIQPLQMNIEKSEDSDIPVPGMLLTDTPAWQKSLYNLNAQMEQGQGFMPKLIATLAAAKGEFGPVMKLEEQKRKTQVYKALPGVLIEIKRLSDIGKPEDAQHYANQAYASFGDRAPELGQFISDISKKIDQKMMDRQNQETFIAEMDALIANQPDHPAAAQIKAAKQVMKSKTAYSSQQLNRLIDQITVKSQVNPATGSVVMTTGGAGLTQRAPEYNATPTDLTPYVVQKIGTESQSLGSPLPLGPNDIANIRNGLPVYKWDPATRQMRDINTVQLHMNVLKRIGQLQGIASQQTVAQQNPVTPQFAEQLMSDPAFRAEAAAQNVTPAELLATRGYGAATAQAGIGGVVQRAGDTVKAQQEAQWRVSPMKSSTLGLNIIDKNTGQDHTSQMSGVQAATNPEMAILNNDQAKIARQFFQLRNRLNLLANVINSPELPDTSASLERIGSAIERYGNSWLGFNPQMSAQQAVQAFVKGDIEEYANSAGVSAKRYADALDPLTGNVKPSKQTAVAVLNKVGEMLQQDHDTFVNQHSFTNTPPVFMQGPYVVQPDGKITPVQPGDASPAQSGQQQRQRIIPRELP